MQFAERMPDDITPQKTLQEAAASPTTAQGRIMIGGRPTGPDTIRE
jgi:hypothetical protein